MAVFRAEKNRDYTVMSNHHLRNADLSLKSKGLLSQMLSLPEEWGYTLKGLSQINREGIDAIRELERAGYVTRTRVRNEKGQLGAADYVILDLCQYFREKKLKRSCCCFKFLILLLLRRHITNSTMYSFAVISAFYVFKNCPAGFC